MPQRFLRPGITTSDSWNAVSFRAQSFYIRILTLVDDYGRYDGRAAILHGQCFALRNDVKPQDSAADGRELENAGLIQFYEVGGKKFLRITKWGERVRNSSKFPEPPYLLEDRQDSAADGSQKSLPSPVPIAIVPVPIASTHTPSPSADAEEKSEHAEIQPLDRVKAFFKIKPSTNLDKGAATAWKVAKPIVEQTSDEDWKLLEWAYAQKTGDVAKYRRRGMGSLLNNWNEEISRVWAWKEITNGSSNGSQIDHEKGFNQ